MKQTKSHIQSLSQLLILFHFCMAISCTQLGSTSENRLFQKLSSSQTGINFSNNITENENFNPLVYENTYHGGGVAIGDINGDELDDIYLSANQSDDKLYLNKGGMKFEDITQTAGVAGRKSWKTGTVMADVNGDGLMDIYVCHSGNLPGTLRRNELFINKGVSNNKIPLFKEEAESYGLADSAFSISAAFFDYDKDGDLDMVLLNGSPRLFHNVDEEGLLYLHETTDSLTGVKLYQNNNNHFSEVTKNSGIKNSRLNFTLGVSIADINGDGWPDLYLSNDYMAPDYLYINNGNGTFTDKISESLTCTSQFSMGTDIADLNNDGLADIITMDMLPEGNRRQKQLYAGDNFELFDLRLRSGLHPQYMRNMLQLNNGDGTFSETGQLSGISNTDWSWAPLFADFDNDGYKDLFISNGYTHDYTNLDFLKYENDFIASSATEIGKKDLLALVEKMPSSDVVNYVFKNNGDLTFRNQSITWGFDEPSNSNGAAYADLDNDGDLDLVVNNINKPPFVFQNNADRLQKNNYMQLSLNGEGANRFGLNAKAIVYTGNEEQVQEQLMYRGFQSSVSPVLTFGLGKATTADSLKIIWPSGKEQVLRNVKCNQRLALKERDAIKSAQRQLTKTPTLFSTTTSPLAFTHIENPVNDFKRQPLMPEALSYSGPCMAEGDVNGDGQPDVFIGGAEKQASAIFISRNGKFVQQPQPAFEADKAREKTAAAFFDADGDGDNDLIVGSGGYDRFLPADSLLQSNLYLNDGKGNFFLSSTALPLMNSSVSCITVLDVNNDGYSDIFLGGRTVPGRYPESAKSFLLLNDGKGRFTDITKEYAPALIQPGMLTDAVAVDMNNDGRKDLVTAGDFLPLQVWENKDGKLVENTANYFDAALSGCWRRIKIADVNNDGRPDIIAGNLGLNQQCRVSKAQPAELYYADFDNNGAIDPFLCFYIGDKSYPYVSRDELMDQMTTMRSKFPDYKSYADAQMTNLFSADEVKSAKKWTATTMQSVCLLSNISGKYNITPLPIMAQAFPVFAIAVNDFNKDGMQDLLLAGNIANARIKMGAQQGGYGALFLGDGKGGFVYLPQTKSGLCIKGDVRNFYLAKNTLLVAKNNAAVVAYKIN